jgi:hypothetical protein
VNGGPRFCPLLIAKVTSEGQIEVGPVEAGRPAADRAGRTGRHAEHRQGRSCPAATSQPLTSCRRPQPEMVPKNAAGESMWKPQPRHRTPTRRLSGVGVAGTGAGIDCGGKQPIEAGGPVLWRDYGKDRAPFPGRVFLGC